MPLSDFEHEEFFRIARLENVAVFKSYILKNNIDLDLLNALTCQETRCSDLSTEALKVLVELGSDFTETKLLSLVADRPPSPNNIEKMIFLAGLDFSRFIRNDAARKLIESGYPVEVLAAVLPKKSDDQLSALPLKTAIKYERPEILHYLIKEQYPESVVIREIRSMLAEIDAKPLTNKPVTSKMMTLLHYHLLRIEGSQKMKLRSQNSGSDENLSIKPAKSTHRI